MDGPIERDLIRPLHPNRTTESESDRTIEDVWAHQGELEYEDDDNLRCPWRPEVPPEFRKDFEEREARSILLPPRNLFPPLPDTFFARPP